MRPPVWVEYGKRINEAFRVLRVPEIILPVDEHLRAAIGTTETLAQMRDPHYWEIRRPGGWASHQTWTKLHIDAVPKLDSSGQVWAIGVRPIPDANSGVARAEGGSDAQ